MSRTFHVLEVHVEGARAEAWLNDLPFALRGDGEGLGRYVAGPVNHLLVDGANELSLVLEPLAPPSSATGLAGARRARRVLEEARASARLVRYQEGMVVGDARGKLLAELAWESPDDGGARSWPQAVGCSFDLGKVVGRWAWEGAPRAPLDDAAQGELEALLGELADALEHGDADAFLALVRPRTADLARAYGRSLANKEAELRRLVVDEAASPHRGVLPLEPAAWDLRPIGRGRLLDCVRKDGQAILRGPPRPPEGFSSTYEVRVARLDGAWQVVR